MKIALIGYGKMGKAIEEIANKNGDEVVLKISLENTYKEVSRLFKQIGVGNSGHSHLCSITQGYTLDIIVLTFIIKMGELRENTDM